VRLPHRKRSSEKGTSSTVYPRNDDHARVIGFD
jgi:hypothetical protein